ncbi:MAG TPA: YetF domain-containing protein [Vicinamibacterales bacterium]|nr:YetF domain-containing protein [Vicinamibacterales bacterium]
MSSNLALDWHQIFVPTGSLLELVVRGSLMYLLILAGFRLFRRDAGSLSVSDLLVVVLIADAAQNGMAGEYKSLTEGAVIVATIFAWNYVLDWLAYRSRFVYWLLHPPSLLLIRNGQIQFRNLRSQLITKDDLLEQLREQGVESVARVKTCFLEGDGRMSVIREDDGEQTGRREKQRS